MLIRLPYRKFFIGDEHPKEVQPIYLFCAFLAFVFLVWFTFAFCIYVLTNINMGLYAYEYKQFTRMPDKFSFIDTKDITSTHYSIEIPKDDPDIHKVKNIEVDNFFVYYFDFGVMKSIYIKPPALFIPTFIILLYLAVYLPKKSRLAFLITHVLIAVLFIDSVTVMYYFVVDRAQGLPEIPDVIEATIPVLRHSCVLIIKDASGYYSIDVLLPSFIISYFTFFFGLRFYYVLVKRKGWRGF